MSKFKDEVTGEIKNIVLTRETKCIGCNGEIGRAIKCNNTLCFACWCDAEGFQEE